MTAEWDRVTGLLKKIADTRTHLELLLSEKKRVVRLGNFERARRIETVDLVQKRQIIECLQAEIEDKRILPSTPGVMYSRPKYVVEADDIAEVVSAQSGIPVGKLLAGELVNWAICAVSQRGINAGLFSGYAVGA